MGCLLLHCIAKEDQMYHIYSYLYILLESCLSVSQTSSNKKKIKLHSLISLPRSYTHWWDIFFFKHQANNSLFYFGILWKIYVIIIFTAYKFPRVSTMSSCTKVHSHHFKKNKTTRLIPFIPRQEMLGLSYNNNEVQEMRFIVFQNMTLLY